MSYIPPHKVEEIKAAAEIEKVIMRAGIELKRSGTSYKGICPFHGGSSFMVTPAKGLFKCFGCGKGGDSIKFLMERGKTYPEALTMLAEQFNVML